MAADHIYNCSMCSYFSVRHDKLVSHVIRRHQHDRNFILHCSYEACGISFHNVKSFKSHVYRKHGQRGIYDIHAADGVAANHSEDDLDTVTDSVSTTVSEAAYILKLRARHRLSQAAVSDVCESTKELFRVKLSELNLIRGDSEIDDAFAESLFSGLQTKSNQEKFFTDHFGLVRPQAKKLGTVRGTVAKGNKHQCVEKSVQGYYVPLKEQLQALLCMPEVQQCLCAHNDISDDTTEFVHDISEAYYVRHHALKAMHTTLQLCLYTDDFEIVNCIGTHRKKHKLTAFYWTLLNIPAEYRSQLSCIQLLALAKTKDVRKYGMSLLLQDFVDTLIALEQGIELTLDGYGVQTYNGFLVCVLADTPAAQLIGGFKEGVGTALSPCRSCDAKQTDLAQMHSASECPMRNLQEHTDRLAYLHLQNKQGFKYWSKFWGVNGPSALAVPGFDVTKCVLHDPMHLILEGVAKVHMKAMLRIFIYQKKYFSLAYFNNAVQQYTFSSVELRDKPEVIDRKALERSAVFPQTAAAMKNLLINLPYIIGDKVADDDEHWQNFIVMLQILILSISPIISVNTPSTLEALIAVHNKKFVDLYSEDLFTPKFHYLIHLPQQMRLFGPLRNHWCMRFESKNGFFKLKRWFNFRNLPKSLSFYHQEWMCLQMIQTSGCRSTVYLYCGDKVSEGHTVAVETLPGIRTVLESEFGSEELPVRVMCTNCVVVNGLTYAKGTVLLESIDNIQFLEVQTVVIHEQVKYLHCLRLNVLLFDSHRNAFRVERSNSVSVVRVRDLHYRWPQVVHHCDCSFFVTLQNADDVWHL